MRVLVDAGYRAMAVHILGEMGLDNVDGAESSENGVRSEDDLVCAGSSRWPGPDHRPDLTSLSLASAGTGDKCQAVGAGEASGGVEEGRRVGGEGVEGQRDGGSQSHSLTGAAGVGGMGGPRRRGGASGR